MNNRSYIVMPSEKVRELAVATIARVDAARWKLATRLAEDRLGHRIRNAFRLLAGKQPVAVTEEQIQDEYASPWGVVWYVDGYSKEVANELLTATRLASEVRVSVADLAYVKP